MKQPGNDGRWVLTARAKINLTLYVLGKRPDGYHDLELIFQPVSLADELTICENDTDSLRFTCSVKAFENENNLVCRGYAALRQRFPGRIPGLDIHLEKHIPSGAGMGGGSTDCSALMVWLNRQYRLGMPREELITAGAALGADVPACMIPHATLGRGIGERLTDIHTELRLPLLVVKPSDSYSTGEMYGRVDAIPYDPASNRNEAVIRAMESGNASALAENLYNVFEETVPAPERVRALKERLINAGAIGALMTGSGSAIYGIFSDISSRDTACSLLAGDGDYALYPCEMVNEWE